MSAKGARVLGGGEQRSFVKGAAYALPRALGRETASILEHWLPRIWPQAVFAPDFLPRMNHFAELLARWGHGFNLTSRPDDPAALAFHIIDSASPLAVEGNTDAPVVRGYFDRGRLIADIGSGCGFPGIVLAAGCSARLILFEPRRKRAAFLRIAITELGLDNAEVSTSKLPSPEICARFDSAVGRALGAPEKFYHLARGVLLEDGIAILYATRSQAAALASAEGLGFTFLGTWFYRLPTTASLKSASFQQSKLRFSPDRALIVWQKKG
jgi:16S rRNA (guanine(527)-N(7))-methyltransferase RsmG